MRLSMHGDEESQQQDQHHPGHPASLRPSLVKRGSAAAAELGMNHVQSSNMSLMSDVSAFGSTSNHAAVGNTMNMNMYGFDSARRSSAPHAGSNEPFGGGLNPYASQDSMDRRRIFAKMKYARAPSDRMSSGRQMGGTSMHSIGDGMPDFHMVESQLSLYSNLSGMTGGDSRLGEGGDSKRPSAGADMLGGAGSRHSIMSGLSRISDTSEVNSIFSDLSRKLGNVSTRSIAMSEFSGVDAYRGGVAGDGDSESTPSFGEAPPAAPSNAMDFDVDNVF